MKRIVPILMLAMLVCIRTRAQQVDSVGTRHTVAIRFGLNQIRDENLHPKVSSGTITELSYGFECRGDVIDQFHFALGYSRPATAFEDVAKTANLKLNIGCNRNYLLVRDNTFRYYLGPQVDVAYNATYLPNWDDSHLYWADYFSIGINNVVMLRTGDNTEWITSLSIPLFSVSSRPDLYRLYKIDDVDFSGITRNLNSNLTPGFWGTMFHLRLQSEYRFPVFTGKTEALTYSFEYFRMKHTDGNPFTQISHQIGLKVML